MHRASVDGGRPCRGICWIGGVEAQLDLGQARLPATRVIRWDAELEVKPLAVVSLVGDVDASFAGVEAARVLMVRLVRGNNTGSREIAHLYVAVGSGERVGEGDACATTGVAHIEEAQNEFGSCVDFIQLDDLELRCRR